MMRANLNGEGSLSIHSKSWKDRQDEPIQAVSDCDIERFAKDAVALLRVGDDLGVTAGDVKDDRGRRGSD